MFPVIKSVAVVAIPSLATSGLFRMIVFSVLAPMSEILLPLMGVSTVSPRSYVPFGMKILVRLAPALTLAMVKVLSKWSASPALTT